MSAGTGTRRPLPLAADLYGDIQPAKEERWRDYPPGLLVAVLASLASAYLAEHYGAPLTLMALLVGLALNFLNGDRRLAPGLAFASRTLLRIGIVLVGARVTLAQIVGLGPVALAAVVVITTLTMLAGVLAADRLGFGRAFGALAGGAVAICGASAALALATVLGERRINQAQLALVLVGIAAWSAAAMVAYPAICHHLGFADRQAGFVLGAAIHDVAQALGAGYAFSPAAGQDAAIVKLTRVALLAPALAIVARLFPQQGEVTKKQPLLPWYVAGFFVFAAINSTGMVPAPIGQGATDLATGMLVCAVTATGIRSPMASLLESGPKPLLTISIASLVALILSCLAAAFLIR
jgi:uncharacterized integral membrane protein (TIGR00698 family)